MRCRRKMLRKPKSSSVNHNGEDFNKAEAIEMNGGKIWDTIQGLMRKR